MVQTKKIDDRVEIIFEARECVVAAFYDSLAAGSVVRHRLAVIQHFISRLLQQVLSMGPKRLVLTLAIRGCTSFSYVLLRLKRVSWDP